MFFEQPCPTLEECLYVRERTTLPMVLDEVITDAAALFRAFHEARWRRSTSSSRRSAASPRRASDARARRDARPAVHDRGHLGRRPRRPPRSATSPPRHAAEAAVDGLVHERLDARPHRRLPPALARRPAERAERPGPRRRRRSRRRSASRSSASSPEPATATATASSGTRSVRAQSRRVPAWRASERTSTGNRSHV